MRLSMAAAALAAAAALVFPTMALAQQQEPRLLEPRPGAVVQEGQTITIRLQGCVPHAIVEIWYRGRLITGRATADGTFRSRVTIPDRPRPADAEPDLVVNCGGRTAGVVRVRDMPAALPTGVSRFSVVPNVVRPGQRVTLAGSGCPAHARVTLQWNVAVNSVNVAPIGTVTATADGSFRTTWMVPDRMRPGRFQISADCGQRLLGSAILTVVETTTTKGILPFTGPRNAGPLLLLSVGLLGSGLAALGLARRYRVSR